jgi:membrane protein
MQVRAFVRKLVGEVSDDDVVDVAAMMSHYAIFALFPMLLFVITIGLLVVPASVLQEGVAMATATLPPDVGTMIGEQVGRMQQTAGAGFALLGAVLALWGASRGANALGFALNRVHGKKESRPWWKRQLLAVAVTLVVALIMITAMSLLLVGPAGQAVADRFGLGGAFGVLWGIGRWLAAGFLVMLTWAILYRFMPDTHAPFRIFTPGAAIGVLLWLGISQAFAFYLARFGDYEATYGTLAGVIVFMTWLWLSNIALLLGAEINDVLADLRQEVSPAAAQLAHETAPPLRPGVDPGPEPEAEPAHGPPGRPVPSPG